MIFKRNFTRLTAELSRCGFQLVCKLSVLELKDAPESLTLKKWGVIYLLSLCSVDVCSNLDGRVNPWRLGLSTAIVISEELSLRATLQVQRESLHHTPFSILRCKRTLVGKLRHHQISNC